MSVGNRWLYAMKEAQRILRDHYPATAIVAAQSNVYVPVRINSYISSDSSQPTRVEYLISFTALILNARSTSVCLPKYSECQNNVTVLCPCHHI